MTAPLKMYGILGPTKVDFVLKWVGKWPVTDCYFELLGINMQDKVLEYSVALNAVDYVIKPIK